MAVTNITTNMVAGVKYTQRVESLVDYSAVTNNTYFYNLDDKQPYYKDINGDIINIFSKTTPYEIYRLISGTTYTFENNINVVVVTTSATTTTLAHTQNVGADGVLVVTVAQQNSESVTGMTYNGVAMTQVRQDTSATYSSRYASYYLTNPATGSNNIIVSFSGAQWNSTAIFAQSYSGCGGIGNTGYNDAATTPHSQSLTISAGSSIYAMGNSSSAQNFGYVVDGVTLTNVGNGFNINNQVESAYSAVIAGAGSKTVNTVTDFGTITNYRIEVLATAATPDIIVSTNTLSGFTYAEGLGPSAEQTFTVSGDNLTASVTVTASANWEVSTTSGSGFGASVVLTQSGGNVVGEPVTIYTRMKAGLAIADYISWITNVTSTGATTEQVSMNGSVTANMGDNGDFFIML